MRHMVRDHSPTRVIALADQERRDGIGGNPSRGISQCTTQPTPAFDLLKMFEYTDIETRLIQTAMADKLGLLRGQNPVFIVKGEKT